LKRGGRKGTSKYKKGLLGIKRKLAPKKRGITGLILGIREVRASDATWAMRS